MSITYRQLRKRLYATKEEKKKHGKHGRLLSRKERLELVNFTCRTLAIKMRLVVLGAGDKAAPNGKGIPYLYLKNKPEIKSLYAELLQLQQDGYTDSNSELNLMYNASPHYAAQKYNTTVTTIYHILRIYAKTGSVVMPGDSDYQKKKPKQKIARAKKLTPQKQGDDQAALDCARTKLSPLSTGPNDPVTTDIVAVKSACSRLLNNGVSQQDIDLETVEYYRDDQGSDAPPIYYSINPVKRNIAKEISNLQEKFRVICHKMIGADEVARYSFQLQLDKLREEIALLKVRVRRKSKRVKRQSKKSRISRKFKINVLAQSLLGY